MKAIFIHTPKCGGMTMSKICRDNGILIDPVNQDPQLINERRESNAYTSIEKEKNIDFSFSFVRNPFGRLVSAWKCPWVSCKKINNESINMFNNFSHFVKDFALKESDWPFFRWSHAMPFTDPRQKLFDRDGKKILDFIGKVESYKEDFKFVCGTIGLTKQELPHRNQTKHKHYTEYYDDETREIVAQKYAKDIEYFGYKFGE
jgi:hypothetical protein